MSATLVDFIIAWREMAKQIREKRRKDAMYRALVGSELNYMILRDLINAAAHDVVVKLTFKDGANLEIRREEKAVRRPPAPDEDLFV